MTLSKMCQQNSSLKYNKIKPVRRCSKENRAKLVNKKNIKILCTCGNSYDQLGKCNDCLAYDGGVTQDWLELYAISHIRGFGHAR